MENMEFHSNNGKGLIINVKQPITGHMGLMHIFTNDELVEFHKEIGEFIEKNIEVKREKEIKHFENHIIRIYMSMGFNLKQAEEILGMIKSDKGE